MSTSFCCDTMLETSSTLDAMNQRFSCRKFDPDYVIPKKTVENLVNAVVNAASSENTQDYDITVITNKDFIKKVDESAFEGIPENYKKFLNDNKELHKLTNRITYDCTLLLIFTKNEQRLKRPESQYVNIGIAIDSAMIAAQSLGLNSCAIGLLRGPATDKVLGLPEGSTVCGVAIGKGMTTVKKDKGQLKKVTYIE